VILVLISVLIIVVVGAICFLGHRQVRHRPPSCKSAQVARCTNLPRRNFAADTADDWNLL